jgi:hypothetical protein
MMDAEVEGICGAAYGEVSPGRVNSRNGYRPGEWDARAGTVELAIPKLWQGTYYPEWLLERRRRAERALATVVATSYLLGVSTRRVEKLAEPLGVTKLSKSQVSLMAAERDGMVTSFRRGTAGPPPGLDAGHHLVSVRARSRRGGVRHRRRAGNARPGGAGRGARSGRGYIPGRERRALPVPHRQGIGSRGRRDADAAVVAATPVSARGRVSRLTPPFRQDAAATLTQWATGS